MPCGNTDTRGGRYKDTQSKCYIKTEAEVPVIQLSTKDCWKHQKLREKHGTDSPLELSETAWHCHHLDLKLLDFNHDNKLCCFKTSSVLVL